MNVEYLRFTMNRPHLGDLICTECEEIVIDDMGSMTLATINEYADKHLQEKHAR